MRAGWVALGAVLATVFAVYAFSQAQAAVGRPAPAFDLPTTTGGRVSLAGLRGQVVLLDFYASWCTVCQEDAPAIATFAARYRGRVAVIGVDWREPASAARQWTAEFALTYPNARDAAGVTATHYGLSGVPETWWIDPAGMARLHEVGPSTFEQLQQDYAVVAGRAQAVPGVAPVPSGAAASGLAVGGGRLWVAVTGSPSAGLWSRPLAGGSFARAALPVAVAGVAGDGNDLLAVAGGQLWGSRGGGSIWTALETGAMGAPSALAGSRGRWYAWGQGRLWACASWGGAWSPLPVQPPVGGARVAALAAQGERVLVAAAGTAWLSTDGGQQWTAVALRRPAMGTAEFSSAAQVITDQVPLQPAGATFASDGTPVYAGPDGLYAGGSRLVGAPARALVAVARQSDGTLWLLAPDGDVYSESPRGTWALMPSGPQAAGSPGAAP